MSALADQLQPSHAPVSFSLAGKTALVTGGGQGIGWAIASGFVQAGARIAIAGRNAEVGEAAVAKLQASGTEASFFLADLGQPDDIEVLFDEIGVRFGAIDILVNNSAMVLRGVALDLNLDDWNAQLAVNLTAPWLCSRRAVQLMPAGGRIINIVSLNATRPGKNKFSYGVTKAGLVQLTRALATEWADRNIAVNAIAPGMVSTPRLQSALTTTQQAEALARIPLGRAGAGGDIAGVAVFLASDAASYITGQVITVDGGSCLT